MKKFVVVLIFCLTGSGFAFGQNQVPGTKITSAVVPNDLRDDIATHVDTFGAGGYRPVETIAQRNAIKPSRLTKNMLVYVAADSTYYQYTGSGWKKARLGGTDSQYGTFIISTGGNIDNPPYPVINAGAQIKYTKAFTSEYYTLNISCYNRFGSIPYLISSKQKAYFSLQVAETCTCVYEAKP